MRLLLDTHVLLWAAGAPERLPEAARALLEDRANTVCFSVASLWEIVIKRALGREDFVVDPARLRMLLVANGFEELYVTADHALAMGALPPIHRDPFDRVLVAQAREEQLLLLTSDRTLESYGDGVRCV